MQFHLNGFIPGSPDVSAAADSTTAGDSLPAEVDVLIVGCGPAGLTLAAQLARFPSIKTAIIEQKDGPLQLGQADGIACRTMEMFNAFGFAGRVLREAYWVNETTFWTPDPQTPGHISRSGRIQDTPDGMSEFPHVILNQARVHDFFLDVMRNAPTRAEPHYSRRLRDLAIGPADASHPVTVQIERTDAAHDGQVETLRARYVVGCDGARSAVRNALGLALRGDSANQAWGVMDVLAVTDFPDVRLKTLIRSQSEGSIVIIPREGGYLFRIYVELDKLNQNERVANRNLTVDHLIAATQRILRPYAFEAREIPWWSVYEIGQRLCDRFDDLPADAPDTRAPHVFIAGDACHTHSPKAGQGMNVSMRDAFNLGWKLAAVLEGRSDSRLLRTYSGERQAVARELIDFDREWTAVLSGKPRTGSTKGADPAEVQSYFERSSGYTAGTTIRYSPSLITAEPVHQPLAPGFEIGTRLHSAPVIRLADARPLQLGHVIEADGRWRLFVFAGPEDPAGPQCRVRALCGFLAGDPASPVRKYTPQTADPDSVIDVRAVFQQPHRSLALSQMPAFLLPHKGRYGLCDYEKLFCADPAADIFEARGLDRDAGCMVVVRPDQHVANVLPLGAHADLAAFFDRFMTAPA